ncbi:MAG TPA: rhodanese-like domain-containing protein [Acidimicrobiales bacterium]|nr:rhodanese-like domain-containing protein [Acidimicrobiales bacterium]
MTASPDDLLARARARIGRVTPADLATVAAEGGLVIDIRPSEQRRAEGELDGALVIERNVLEWRLDPAGSHRIPEVRGYDQPVVIVCSAGFASSLAAASLADMGFERAADLAGGYLAWADWAGRSPPGVGGGPAGDAGAR